MSLLSWSRSFAVFGQGQSLRVRDEPSGGFDDWIHEGNVPFSTHAKSASFMWYVAGTDG